MSSAKGILNRKIKDATKETFICKQCGMTYTMSYGNIRHYKGNYAPICRQCKLQNAYKNHTPEMKAKKAMTGLQNLSGMKNATIDEMVAKTTADAKARWENKSPEEKLEHARQSSINMHNRWDNISEAEMEIVRSKQSKVTKKWLSTLTPEEKAEISRKQSESQKKRWAAMSKEERQKIAEQRRTQLKKWHEETPEEIKIEWRAKISKSTKKNWDNMTPEERLEWDIRRAEGAAKAQKTRKTPPSELEFQNIMNSMHISYDTQIRNMFKHPDFDKLFPCNPVVHNSMVSYEHNWDFKLHLLSTDMFVDIDGSIHDKDKTKTVTMVYLTTKERVSTSEFIEFNDSKRPYQTDGLPAYVVLAYKDTIDPDTDVLNVESGSTMPFHAFLMYIEFLNLPESQQKKIANM